MLNHLFCIYLPLFPGPHCLYLEQTVRFLISALCDPACCVLNYLLKYRWGYSRYQFSTILVTNDSSLIWGRAFLGKGLSVCPFNFQGVVCVNSLALFLIFLIALCKVRIVAILHMPLLSPLIILGSWHRPDFITTGACPAAPSAWTLVTQF